ncbi:hypothetical protein OCV67_10775 [Porcipelethomonas ammoniilytica]|nr:hypothetical protein [Porcipelethomonas ammoniilytica]MCU6720408.1 hypothetical protein [Porcipelethomonas ammoniilytica]
MTTDERKILRELGNKNANKVAWTFSKIAEERNLKKSSPELSA